YTSNVTIHRTLIALLRGDTTTETVNSFTDTRGNTWVLGASALQTSADGGTAPQDAHQIRLYYVADNVATGADTVTAVWSASNAHTALAVFEFSGLSNTSPLDQTSTNVASTATSTITSGTTVATSFAHELVFGGSGYYWGSFFGGGASPQVIPGTGFTASEVNEGS